MIVFLFKIWTNLKINTKRKK